MTSGSKRVSARPQKDKVARTASARGEKAGVNLDPKQLKIWETDDLVFAEIDSQTIANIEYDASKLDHLIVSSSNIRHSVFRNLKGHLDLGVGERLSTLERCLFVDCRISVLRFGYVFLDRCEFENCDIRELWAFDADLKNCKFSGHIRKGAFNISPEAQKFPHGERIFIGNDFSACAIETDIFRGGIDLRRQKFSETDGSLVIRDVAAFLTALKAKLDRMKPNLDLERFVSMTEYMSKRFKQPSIFVSARDINALGESRKHVFETLRLLERSGKPQN